MRCWLGMHQWRLGIIVAFIPMTRLCRKCGKVQRRDRAMRWVEVR